MKDHSKEYLKMIKDKKSQDDEILELLSASEEEDDDEDDEYEPSVIKISMPQIPTPTRDYNPDITDVEHKEHKSYRHPVLMTFFFFFGFGSLFWMLYKLIAYRQLHLLWLNFAVIGIVLYFIFRSQK